MLGKEMNWDRNQNQLVGVWERDLEGNSLSSNELMNSIVNIDPISANPSIKEFADSFLHKDDQRNLAIVDEQVFKTKSASQVDVRIRVKPRVYNWFKVIYQIQENKKGDPTSILMMFIPINEIKKKEQSKVQRENLLLETQKALSIGTWTVDLKKNEAVWSDEVYRIHEVPIGTEINVAEAINYYREDFRPVIGKAVEDAIKLKTRLDIDAVLVTTSGVEKWVQATFFPVFGESDEAEFIHGIFMDIDDRVRSKLKTEIQKETIELATATGGIGVWDWNLSNNELTWNDKMLDLYEMEEDEFHGSYADYSNLVHPNDIERVEEEIQNALTGVAPLDTEFRLLLNGNKIKFLLAKAIIIKDESGKNQRMVGINVDITEQKELETRQAERTKKLADINELLEDEVQHRTQELTLALNDLETLTYSISHDLRAPLRAINGFINIIQEEFSKKIEEEGFEELFGFITDNATKMDERIRSILDYYRMGASELQYKEIYMEDLFNEEFNEIVHSYPNQVVELTIDPIPSIQGDVVQLRHVVQNLLDNAIKYSSKKEKSIIHIRSTRSDTDTKIYVKDNGTGFDMQYVDKLFLVFQRLHHEKEFKGTGVGLSIAKRIMERHNGNITAKSRLGEWTEFCLIIPNKDQGE